MIETLCRVTVILLSMAYVLYIALGDGNEES